jgi:hypothetical protein
LPETAAAITAAADLHRIFQVVVPVVIVADVREAVGICFE